MKLKQIIVVLASAALLQGCIAAAGVAVVGGAAVATDKRTLGKQIDDQGIELDAYNQLSENKSLKKQTNISVISMNASLLIIGQAPTPHLKNEAMKILNNIKGVEQVHDHLRLGNPIAVTTKTNDAWLTTKIKAKLFASDKFNATNIKVVTENAEVFLLGLVSEADASEAVEITRNVAGVSRVYKMFEYQE